MDKILSVVIPVFNEEQVITVCLKNIINILNEYEIPFDIIVVDDGSKDNTLAKIIELSYNHISIIRLSRNFGKEGAIFAGLDNAKGECIVVMDCDMQHPPALLPTMYLMWYNKGCEIVEAVKKYPHNQKGRTLENLFYRIFNKISGIEISNKSDFILMDRKVLECIKKMPERQTFFRAMATWVGFKRERLYFTPPKRQDGKGKWSKYKLCKLAVSGITAFSAVPLYFINIFGGIFLLFAFIMFVQTLYMKFSGKAVEGFTTVILILLIACSVILLSIGVLGVYMSKIYEELKHRPRYIIAEKIDFSE